MTNIPQTLFKEGIEKAIRNGDELFKSAQILFKEKKYPASSFLAYQAVEEYGKAMLLIEDIKKGNKEISKSRWDDIYKSHPKKLAIVRRKLQNILYKRPLKTQEMNIPEEQIMEEVIDWTFLDKILSMYVNWDFEKCSWITPQEYVDSAVPSSVLFLAINTKRVLDIILEDLKTKS